MAWAWGDEGHEIVALVADHYLDAAVRTKIHSLLAADSTHLTVDTGLASEATWADKFRDSDRNTTKVHYNQTHEWHFVDIEIDQPNIDTACFHHPVVPVGTPASQAVPTDCVVDKIDEFLAELSNPATAAPEKLIALQFVLHFVGDVHQPLHASDSHDAGGNQKRVSAKGFKAGNLHHFWDTEFVQQLGTDPTQVAQGLVTKITTTQQKTWSTGTPAEWAQESFTLAKTVAYGMLPTPNAKGSYRLPASYIKAADRDAAIQLSKAGVRLAFVLNQALK